MKSAILVLALSTAALAQATDPPSTDPQLSTAERIAIQALEKQKQDGLSMYQQAQQQEAGIVGEFSRNHPGYRVSPPSFNVEKDAPPPAPAKKEEKPK